MLLALRYSVGKKQCILKNEDKILFLSTVPNPFSSRYSRDEERDRLIRLEKRVGLMIYSFLFFVFLRCNVA